MQSVNHSVEDLEYDAVARNLGETRYIIHKRILRMITLRLTWPDLAVAVAPAVVLWNVLNVAGAARTPMPIVSLPFEPFGLLGMVGLTAIGASVMHKYRPEGDILMIVQGFVTPKRFRAYSFASDRRSWSPGNGRQVFSQGARSKGWKF